MENLLVINKRINKINCVKNVLKQYSLIIQMWDMSWLQSTLYPTVASKKRKKR